MEEFTDFKVLMFGRAHFCPLMHKKPQGEKTASSNLSEDHTLLKAGRHCQEAPAWPQKLYSCVSPAASNSPDAEIRGVQNTPTIPNNVERLQIEPGFLPKILSRDLTIICSFSYFSCTFEIWFSCFNLQPHAGGLYRQRRAHLKPVLSMIHTTWLMPQSLEKWARSSHSRLGIISLLEQNRDISE